MDKDIDTLIDETAQMDNSRLEEIMAREMTAENQSEFFKLFRESQLIMPVTYASGAFEGLENAEVGDIVESSEDIGFSINYLKADDGTRAVPLFTSSEMMEKTGLRSSSFVLYTSDLADLLRQTDKYSSVTVNPFTEHDAVIPMHVFLNLFYGVSEEEREFMESLDAVLKALKEHSVELEDNYAFMYRSDEKFMAERATDGVYVPEIPFTVSSNPKYGMDMKYANIILMDKSKKILPIGPEAELDIVIAPGTEFVIEKELDEFTTVWRCGAQPFYDE